MFVLGLCKVAYIFAILTLPYASPSRTFIYLFFILFCCLYVASKNQCNHTPLD